jgi:hypothetical protein
MNNNCNTVATSAKRPLALTVLALSVFGLSLGLLLNRIRVDSGFDFGRAIFPMLNMAAAVGLLKYRAGWRKYILVIASFWAVMVLLFAPWAMFNPERIVVSFPAILVEDRPHQLESWFTVALALLANAAALGWALWVLLRRDVRGLFHQAGANRIRTN